MSIKNIRKEVMLTLEKSMDTFMNKYLIPAEKNMATHRFFTQLTKRFIYSGSRRNSRVI